MFEHLIGMKSLAVEENTEEKVQSCLGWCLDQTLVPIYYKEGGDIEEAQFFQGLDIKIEGVVVALIYRNYE